MPGITHTPADRTLYQTRDYNIFVRPKANRALDPERVNKLARAIQKDNRLATNPITVNDKMEIMDGQHRLEAAKRLGVMIYYIIDPSMTIRHAAMLNNNTKSWGMADYLHFQVEEGNPEYIALDRFCKEYPWLPLHQAALLCSTGSHHGDFHYRFGEGVYEADRVKFATEVADMLLDFKPYCEFYAQKAFIAAIRGLHSDENYHHARLLRKLKSKPAWLVHAGNSDEYYDILNRIYNYREPKERWVKFWRVKPGQGREKSGRFTRKTAPGDEELEGE